MNLAVERRARVAHLPKQAPCGAAAGARNFMPLVRVAEQLTQRKEGCRGVTLVAAVTQKTGYAHLPQHSCTL